MWTCPKCGRQFKRINQSHYCGQAPLTIDQYIQTQPEEIQAYLYQIRKTIAQAIPLAKEKISWSMPTFFDGCNVIQFAASKKHIGLYPGEAAVTAFAKRLEAYPTRKGTIQIPYQQPLPLELISDIAKWCYERRND